MFLTDWLLSSQPSNRKELSTSAHCLGIASLAELVGCNKKRQERESYKAHLKPDSAASELVGEVALRTKDSVLTAPELQRRENNKV